MAIMGFLVHTQPEKLNAVEAQVKELPEMTTYGVQKNQYVVVVAEAPSEIIEDKVNRINDFAGVLSIYTTYLTIEDEIDEDGSLQTGLSLFEVIKKRRPAEVE